MDDDLRAAVRQAAAPAPATDGDRRRVMAAVVSRRRRRRTVVAAAATSLAVVGVAVVALVVGDRPQVVDGDDPAPAPPAGSTAEWSPVAASVLSPRHDPLAAWTGEEVVVVGGSSSPPCPPGADCAVIGGGERADAAAYDPATDSWHRLPDAPAPVAGGRTVWTGAEMVVVSGRTTLAFDPEREEWRRLDAVPVPAPSVDYDGDLVMTGLGPVLVPYDQAGPGREPQVDWRLDVATGTWEALPHDPFGESYDRSMAWDGERLWLLSMAVENHFGAYEGAPARVAVLEDGAWRVVDETTPPVTQTQRWYWHDDRLVLPTGPSGGVSRTYDPATGTWDDLGGGARSPCRLLAAGVGVDWVTSGGRLASASPPDVVGTPACDEFGYLATAVWAGTRLFVWGGTEPSSGGGSGGVRNTAAGWIWTPPAPGR